GVEALDVAVLPRTASLDVSGLGADSCDPFLHGLGDELRSVVGADVTGDATQDEEVGQNVDHIDRLELAGDTDRQAFMGELVEHVEHPVLASLVGAVLDKVVGPDMIALLRPQPNARSVGQPEPAALGLLMGNLQPLTLPDTLDPLVVDCPARLAQQRGDLAIAIAAVWPGKLDNSGGETPLLRRAHWAPSVHRQHDLAPRLGVKPVGELGQPLVQPAPELNAGGHRWRRLDRAQARDVLVANPAVLPAVLNQAHCQPIRRLAKVHEHCSGTIGARSLPSEAGLLWPAPASSWRTTCHSITSSARASKVGGISRPRAFAVVMFMMRSNLVGCSTGISAGFAPRRILSTKSAARRSKSGKLAP